MLYVNEKCVSKEVWLKVEVNKSEIIFEKVVQAERELEGWDPNRQEPFNPQHGFVSINFLGVLKSMNIMWDLMEFLQKKNP